MGCVAKIEDVLHRIRELFPFSRSNLAEQASDRFDNAAEESALSFWCIQCLDMILEFRGQEEAGNELVQVYKTIFQNGILHATIGILFQSHRIQPFQTLAGQTLFWRELVCGLVDRIRKECVDVFLKEDVLQSAPIAIRSIKEYTMNSVFTFGVFPRDLQGRLPHAEANILDKGFILQEHLSHQPVVWVVAFRSNLPDSFNNRLRTA